ncbi:ANTAR domain-containing protein, partial [Mycobacterium sp.]|uniref:ANTAR domain-containing protein n=1 Tax=Mycobacterium sp. TaxID=1785 RepID=UPI002CF89FD4
MTIDWVPAQLPLDTEGRRIVDTALGILIGVRRCSSDAAFQELHGAAQRHRIPAFPMAWALVHLAGGGTESAHTFSAAQSAA